MNFRYAYSLGFFSSLGLNLIKAIIKTLKRFIRKDKLETFYSELSGFLFPEDLVILPRLRYIKLIQEKTSLNKQVKTLEDLLKDLEKETIDLKKETESIKKESLTLGIKELEIQEKFNKLEAEQKEILEEFEKTLKEKEDLEKKLKIEEKRSLDLKGKNESLQETLKALQKKSQENSKIITGKILTKLLPKIKFVGNSLQYIACNLDTLVLEILREIHYNGGEIKANKVESAPDFFEKHLGNGDRIYFERPSQNGRIRILISTKNRQKQDIRYLRSLRG